MLKKFPEIDQTIKCLKNGELYVIKGEVFLDFRGQYPYFVDKDEKRIVIDEQNLQDYKIMDEQKRKTSVEITGSTVNAWNYQEDATNFTLDFKILTNAGLDTLKVIDEFQEDVAKLIEEKYSN